MVSVEKLLTLWTKRAMNLKLLKHYSQQQQQSLLLHYGLIPVF